MGGRRGTGDDRRMRHSLLLVVLVGACAPGFEAVPQHDWTIVPAARRAAIDAAYQADVARTRAELRAAQAAEVTMPRAAQAHAAPRVHVAAPGGPWAAVMRDYEAREADARAQIDVAEARRERAARGLADARVRYLTLQLDELRCAHELDRARAIDHSLLGDDTYDTGTYQGQLARVQARWYAAKQQVDAAASALQRANGDVVANKEAYAAIVRTPPGEASSAAALRLSEESLSAGRGELGFRPHVAASYLTPPRLAGL